MNVPAISVGPKLIATVGVFVVGFICGVLIQMVSRVAALAALLLGAAGFFIPPAIGNVVASVLNTVYIGNELFFISGVLFGISIGE